MSSTPELAPLRCARATFAWVAALRSHRHEKRTLERIIWSTQLTFMRPSMSARGIRIVKQTAAAIRIIYLYFHMWSKNENKMLSNPAPATWTSFTTSCEMLPSCYTCHRRHTISWLQLYMIYGTVIGFYGGVGHGWTVSWAVRIWVDGWVFRRSLVRNYGNFYGTYYGKYYGMNFSIDMVILKGTSIKNSRPNAMCFRDR